jgi:hypothetical protein
VAAARLLRKKRGKKRREKRKKMFKFFPSALRATTPLERPRNCCNSKPGQKKEKKNKKMFNVLGPSPSYAGGKIAAIHFFNWKKKVAGQKYSSMRTHM